ncbi:hypothetical protein SLEP1_g22003 [Rubroshorea leprosula]|uniref:Uncharacterized protein n=1 Tax=Rubroshorea leprosula TaxID=152421 RepID=A0AAV5JD67_9ROSI|nr:hypothetical protein SLEP1_g22003 [Rubroshorea leprosula]
MRAEEREAKKCLQSKQVENLVPSQFSPGTIGKGEMGMEVAGEMKGPRFPLSFWEVAGASMVVLGFILGLLGVYLTLPASDYSFLKLPRSLEDLQILRILHSGCYGRICHLHKFLASIA